MTILTQPEIDALLAQPPRPDRTGQLLAVVFAIGVMAGIALSVMAVYAVMTLD